MGNKRLSSSERREEILNIALEIIFNQGFYNLTIRNIADKVNLSEAALYRHFKNKKEIIDCLVDLVFEKNKITMDYEDPFLLLEKIMAQHMEEFEKEPRLTAITFQEEIFREYPDIRQRFYQNRKAKEDNIVRIIERGKREGLFKEDVDPRSFTLIYMGSIRMAVLKWRGSGFSYNIKGESSKIINELFKLLRKE